MSDLTIVIPTYNKEKYIAECLDSIFSQQTSYSFSILVADDCSTDDTLNILKKYQRKHPGQIRILTSSKNQKLYKNVIRAYAQLSSKYWCVLDPDDYWCDMHHIQKALDFLEKHKDFTIYGANIVISNPDGSTKNCDFAKQEKDSSWENYLKGNAVIPFTNGVVYRNVVFCNGLPQYVINPISKTQSRSFRGDSFRNALHIKQGKAHYCPEVHAVYRITAEGVWQSMNELQQNILNCVFYKDLWLFFDKKYPELLVRAYVLFQNTILHNLLNNLKKIGSTEKFIDITKEIIDLNSVFEENTQVIQNILRKNLPWKYKALYGFYKYLHKKFETRGVL